MQFVFQGSNWVSQVCWLTFYKQGPVRRWICTSFDTERWSSYKRSVPAIKDPGHDSELQMQVKRHQMSVFCSRSALKFSSLFSSAHGTPPGARLFSERIVKLYLSFINMIKLKTFWRYEGCSTTVYVLKINVRLGETVCVMPPLMSCNVLKSIVSHPFSQSLHTIVYFCAMHMYQQIKWFKDQSVGSVYNSGVRKHRQIDIKKVLATILYSSYERVNANSFRHTSQALSKD